MHKYITVILALFVFASCEKEINIDLKSSEQQIVIEGNVSDDAGPHSVKLSKTVNFSDANTYPPVTGALVIISDNTGVADTLTETTAGLYQTHRITGTPGHTYTLNVVAEGKQYEAISIMPYKINLDSIQFTPFSSPGSTETLAVVPLYQDPAAFGDNYRFFFSENGVPDKSYQVGNDNIGNGHVNQQPYFPNEDDVKIYKGDTVQVTMLCIDVSTYNYFYTMSQFGGGPGGGTTPSNPPSNITGGKALGIFSAHTTQTKTTIAK